MRLNGFRCDLFAECQQLTRGPAELQFNLLRLKETTVQRIVTIYAYAAMEVLRRMHDSLAAECCPVFC